MVSIEQGRLDRRKAGADACAKTKPQPAAAAERPRPPFMTKSSQLEKLRDLD